MGLDRRLSPHVHHNHCIQAYDTSAIWYWPPPLGATIATGCLRKWAVRLPSHALWCPSCCGWYSHVFDTLRSCPDQIQHASNQNLHLLHEYLQEHVGATFAVPHIKPVSNLFLPTAFCSVRFNGFFLPRIPWAFPPSLLPNTCCKAIWPNFSCSDVLACSCCYLRMCPCFKCSHSNTKHYDSSYKIYKE